MSMNISTNYANLSSGYKINRAKDDPSGMAIAQKMKQQENTSVAANQNNKMYQAKSNVIDGALANIQQYQQDIDALNVKKQNGLLSESDIKAIDNQIDQYNAGIADITNNTTFNESRVLSTSEDAVSQAVKNGAVLNGLEAQYRIGEVSAESAMAARSQVEDTDMAKEVSELKKNQVLQTASVLMQKRQQEDAVNLTSKLFSQGI